MEETKVPAKKKPTREAQPDGSVTSVRIPAAIRKRAKILAAQDESSLSTVLTAALEEYLRKRGA